jgi:nitroreductase
MNPATPVSELIRIRTSRRTFHSEPFTEEVSKNIEQKIKEITAGPLGTKAAFSLISLQDVSSQKLKLGTYGFIQGARYFIAGQIKPSKETFLDYGYNLEKLILEFTRMGLGTCWLGGTFDRGEFAKAIELQDLPLHQGVWATGLFVSVRVRKTGYPGSNCFST